MLQHAVDDSELSAILSKRNLVVVDFFATWCGPCQYIAPQFEDFSRQYPDWAFVKVDVDENSESAQAYNVRAMPTFVFFHEGKEFKRVQGADVGSIKNALESRPANYKPPFAAFSGSGKSLGSSSTATTSSHAALMVNSGKTDPQSVITLDPAAPTSRVRVKLLNGQAVSGTFNETHTMDDLRKFVAAASGVATFSLCLSYPPKTLASGPVTLKDAGVLGGSILQRP
jgi:thioredoxin